MFISFISGRRRLPLWLGLALWAALGAGPAAGKTGAARDFLQNLSAAFDSERGEKTPSDEAEKPQRSWWQGLTAEDPVDGALVSEGMLHQDYFHMVGHSPAARQALKKQIGVIGAREIAELNLVRGTVSEPERSLANAIAQPMTPPGRAQIELFLATPLPSTHRETLAARQELLRFLRDQPELRRSLSERLQRLAPKLELALRLTDSASDVFRQGSLVQRMRGQWDNGFSHRWGVNLLNFSFYVVYGGVAVSLPEVIVNIGHMMAPIIQNGFSRQLLTMALQSGFGAATMCVNGIHDIYNAGVRAPNKRRIRAFAAEIYALILEGQELIQALRRCDPLWQRLSLERDLATAFERRIAEPATARMIDLFRPSWLRTPGSLLEGLLALANTPECLADLVVLAGRIDALVAVANRLAENQDAACDSPQVTLAEVIPDNSHPTVQASGYWLPLIPAEDAVTNDITLGTDPRQDTVAIVNGPNAAGKTAALKAIASNVITASSLGIAFAEAFAFTPIDDLTTALAIKDDIAAGNSRLEREVMAVERYLRKLAGMAGGRFSLWISDEILSGGQSQEMTAAASAIILAVSRQPSVLGVVATHHDGVADLRSQLADEDAQALVNYRVEVVRDDDGAVQPTYHLTPGISHQKVALDFLAKKGIAPEIVAEARRFLAADAA